VLELDTEFVPFVPRGVAALLLPGEPFDIYRPGLALPVLSQQARKLTLPTLILQGKNDANVPAARSVPNPARSSTTLRAVPVHNPRRAAPNPSEATRTVRAALDPRADLE